MVVFAHRWPLLRLRAQFARVMRAGTDRREDDLIMPFPKRIWIAPLIAFLSAGFTLAVAQDRGNVARPAQGQERERHPSRQ